jgi:hypothetical protein
MELRADTVEKMYDAETLIAVTEQEVIGNHIAITNIMKQK